MPATRTTDPQTSHEAEISVTRVNAVQAAILRLLADQPMHDEELISRFNVMTNAGLLPMVSASGIRSRRAELVSLGHVEDSGRRERTWSGRNTIVWQVVA